MNLADFCVSMEITESEAETADCEEHWARFARVPVEPFGDACADAGAGRALFDDGSRWGVCCDENARTGCRKDNDEKLSASPRDCREKTELRQGGLQRRGAC